MKTIFLNLIFVCLISIPLFANTTITAVNSGYQNLSLYEKKLEKYHDSGHYQKDLSHAVELAKQYLEKRIKENQASPHPKKLAVVFDIDETALSGYRVMKSHSFGGSISELNHNMEEAKASAIKPTLALFNYAKKHHIATFFITGRPEWLRHATVKNLHSVGYHGWTGLFLEPNRYHKKSAIPYKSHSRALIEKQGYDIVLAIGDQYSDSKGGYTDRGFKLPNPFYYVP